MSALPMITRRGPEPSVPGFRRKPSVDWLCKAQESAAIRRGILGRLAQPPSHIEAHLEGVSLR